MHFVVVIEPPRPQFWQILLPPHNFARKITLFCIVFKKIRLNGQILSLKQSWYHKKTFNIRNQERNSVLMHRSKENIHRRWNDFHWDHNHEIWTIKIKRLTCTVGPIPLVTTVTRAHVGTRRVLTECVHVARRRRTFVSVYKRIVIMINQGQSPCKELYVL